MRIVTGIALLFALAGQAASADLYLVRHAEKQSGQDPDPGLTARGLQRARHLADYLASAGIERIYTSNYRRTRLTAAPLALALGQDATLYDPRDLDALAGILIQRNENALVVGHSNTTPELAERLGGRSGGDMPEWEYDRILLIDLDGDLVETRILHLPPRSERP